MASGPTQPSDFVAQTVLGVAQARVGTDQGAPARGRCGRWTS